MSRILAPTLVVLCSLCSALPALAGRPRPDDAVVYIISPAEGETVSSPFVVRFGLRGMGIAPAGYHTPTTGHHHLLVDTEALPEPDLPIASDAHHMHFGGGQTETTLTLPPGKHTLRLVLGDMLHVPFSPPLVSDAITITVEGD